MNELNHEQSKNYYDVLEISTSATSAEVHEGYLRAKNAYSQDSLALYSLMGQSECNSMISLVEEAYSILCDTNKRRQYDSARGIRSFASEQTPEKHYSDRSFDSRESSSRASQGLEREIMKASQETKSHQDSPRMSQVSGTNNQDYTPKFGQEKLISKIVANRRYSLEYATDPVFEQEIERATSFDGALLKKIREYKNVDIQRLSEMTKISKTYLLHIENDDFQKLPAHAYVRGFVFQLAKVLRLNPEVVANSYIYQLKLRRDQSGLK
jgi:curved DNA-binding protein CbpA